MMRVFTFIPRQEGQFMRLIIGLFNFCIASYFFVACSNKGATEDTGYSNVNLRTFSDKKKSYYLFHDGPYQDYVSRIDLEGGAVSIKKRHYVGNIACEDPTDYKSINDRLFVLCSGNSEIIEIDKETGLLNKSYVLKRGSFPQQMSINEERNQLYVSLHKKDELYIYDIIKNDLSLFATINLKQLPFEMEKNENNQTGSSFPRPSTMILNKESDRLYVGLQNFQDDIWPGGPGYLIEIDLLHNYKITRHLKLPCENPTQIDYWPFSDKQRILVTCSGNLAKQDGKLVVADLLTMETVATYTPKANMGKLIFLNSNLVLFSEWNSNDLFSYNLEDDFLTRVSLNSSGCSQKERPEQINYYSTLHRDGTLIFANEYFTKCLHFLYYDPVTEDLISDGQEFIAGRPYFMVPL